MIAAYAGGAGSGGKDWGEALLDATEGVFDGERIDREVAEVGDAIFFEGIDIQNGIPRADDGGLHSDVTRAEARPRSIGRAAVERDADDGDVEFLRLRDVRQTHEGGDAGEASVLQSVHRLRVRQVERAFCLLFWHERGILGAACGEVNACRASLAFTRLSLVSNTGGVFLARGFLRS